MKRGWKDEQKIETTIRLLNAESPYQTLAWAYDDVTETLSNLTRAMIVARDGDYQCPMDFSSIEARVSAWLASEELMLKQFGSGLDVYVEMASRVFRVPRDEVDKMQRFIGKQIILGLSYGLGAGKFRDNTNTIAKAMGMEIELTEQFAKDAVATYRDTYWRIPEYWKELEQAAIKATALRPVTKCKAGRITFELEKYHGFVWLNCTLPSGRIIRYPHPRIQTVVTPWGDDRPQLTYLANIQGGAGSSRGGKTIQLSDERHIWRKDSPTYSPKWQRISTWGGTLLENVTQAASADFLREAMVNAHAERFHVTLHCHDEIVCDIRDPADAIRLRAVMTKLPAWADGCPIDAAGYVCTRYRKD